MLSIGGKLGTGARRAELEMIRTGRAIREEAAGRRAGSELGLDRTEKDARVNFELAAKAAGEGGGRTQETHSKAPPTLPSPNLRTAKRGKKDSQSIQSSFSMSPRPFFSPPNILPTPATLPPSIST